jgi:hypothetical protein
MKIEITKGQGGGRLFGCGYCALGQGIWKVTSQQYLNHSSIYLLTMRISRIYYGWNINTYPHVHLQSIACYTFPNVSLNKGDQPSIGVSLWMNVMEVGSRVVRKMIGSRWLLQSVIGSSRKKEQARIRVCLPTEPLTNRRSYLLWHDTDLPVIRHVRLSDLKESNQW